MTVTDPSVKPPPIVLAVSGIEARPVNTPDAPPPVDLQRLVPLPPFQAFALEQMPMARGESDALVHARRFVLVRGSAPDAARDMWDAYCAWHRSQGLWPGETPLGQPLDQPPA